MWDLAFGIYSMGGGFGRGQQTARKEKGPRVQRVLPVAYAGRLRERVRLRGCCASARVTGKLLGRMPIRGAVMTMATWVV